MTNALTASASQQPFVVTQVGRRKAAEDHVLEGRQLRDNFLHRRHGHLRGLVGRKSIHARADAGKGNAGNAVLLGDFERAAIAAGEQLNSEYSNTERPVSTQYASIEAFSRPWEPGKTYSADVEVVPKTEGRFVVFIKSVALPHTWAGAHYPQNGIRDHQEEFVEMFSVQVTKP